MDKVKRLVEGQAVVIFSKTGCPVSHSMKQLISGFGANPIVYELDQMANGHELETTLQMIGQMSCVPPYVFIGGNFVGGPNDVISLQIQGRLVQMLIDAGAIWIWNNGSY